MTFRAAKEFTMEARALTDPKPAFVSIVKAGANQVPFRSVKMDVDASREMTMSERVTAMREQGFEVTRIEIARGDQFPDHSSVTKWLEDGGYPVASMKESDGGFEITNDEDAFIEGTVVQIDTGDSEISIWVGKTEAGGDQVTKDWRKWSSVSVAKPI